MKLRICFSKTEAGRYLSHLDLARTMERSLRRAKAPLAFSEGFNPHPKLSFASALAVGATGRREYLDAELARRVDAEDFCRSLERAFPPALELVGAAEISAGSISLSAAVNLAIYRISAQVAPEDWDKAGAGVEAVLAAAELWRKPKVKPGKKPVPAKEVRGLIRRIEPIGAAVETDEAGDAPGAERLRLTYTLETELCLRQDGQLQPQELWGMIAAAGGFAPEPPVSVCREALLILRDGAVYSPMEGAGI